jgi:hypothetical protein
MVKVKFLTHFLLEGYLTVNPKTACIVIDELGKEREVIVLTTNRLVMCSLS